MDALPNYDFLSAFTAALELTGMADDLRATRLPLTIFAPTNKVRCRGCVLEDHAHVMPEDGANIVLL